MTGKFIGLILIDGSLGAYIPKVDKRLCYAPFLFNAYNILIKNSSRKKV